MEALPHISASIGPQCENAYCKQAGFVFSFFFRSDKKWVMEMWQVPEAPNDLFYIWFCKWNKKEGGAQHMHLFLK